MHIALSPALSHLRRGRFVLPALALLVAAFALAPGARDAHAADASVSIANFAFAPASVSVNAGDTVTWTNNDAGVPHTATADGGAFNSGTLASGASFSHTFTAAGTFAYHCNIHPSMTGTVVVTGAAATALQRIAEAAHARGSERVRVHTLGPSRVVPGNAPRA